MPVWGQLRTGRFEHFGHDQGLSQNTVYCITQDNRGFLWVGTQDGLNKFDGYSFTVYSPQTQENANITGNYIFDLVEDSKGDLWIGTDAGGLNHFKRETESFTHFTHAPANGVSLGKDTINAMHLGRDGVLWMATLNSGIMVLDPATGQGKALLANPQEKGTLWEDLIWTLEEGPDGLIWLGTQFGLGTLDPKTLQVIQLSQELEAFEPLAREAVHSIKFDRNHKVWIGTENGLYCFDRQEGSLSQFRHDPDDPRSITGNYIECLFVDSQDRIWVGTRTGLNLLNEDGKSFSYFKEDPSDPFSLSHDRIISIFEDRAGILWFGTYSHGLNKYLPVTERFRHYRINTRIEGRNRSHNGIYAIHEDRSGQLWIGTEQGLARYDRQTGTIDHFTHNPNDPTSLGHPWVRFVHEDRKGRLWVGTYGAGFDLMDRQRGTFRHFPPNPNQKNAPSNPLMRFVFEDREGILWMGTRGGGLNRFDPDRESLIHFRHDPDNPDSIGHDRVYCMDQDEDGSYWIGTYNGIDHFDPATGTMAHFNHDPNDPSSLSKGQIMALHRDAKQRLWVGTWGGGINRYQPENGSFLQIRAEDGLPNEVIYAILHDNHDYIWASTNNGLTRIHPETLEIRNFNRGDGLQSNEFNAGAFFRSSKGELFFGGINGFNAFMPAEIEIDTRPPPIVITNFRLFNKALPISYEPDAILKKHITETDMLRLSYQDVYFTFEFAALSYANPLRNQYAYRLDGFSRDWIMTDANKRYADFTKIPPGSYTFQVKGSNKDGIWNEEGASIKVVIDPPPWATWYAFILYIAAGLGILFLLIHYQVRTKERELKRQEEYSHILEHRVQERTRELAEKNEEILRAQDQLVIQEKMASLGALTAGVAHEINTPLGIAVTATTHLVDVTHELKKRFAANDITVKYMTEYLGHALQSSDILLHNISRASQLIHSFKQVAVDQTSEAKRRFVIKSYLDEILTSLGAEFRRTHPAIKVSCPASLALDGYPGLFAQIMTNLLMNSMKHGFVEGRPFELDISVVQQGALLIIDYRDNGQGIPPENLNRIFDPFFTTKRGQGGSGLGLHVVYNIVTQQMGGTITCKSEAGSGVHFTIKIPAG